MNFKTAKRPPNPAAKPPRFSKARALPINETYFTEGRPTSRRDVDYRCTGHTCVPHRPKEHATVPMPDTGQAVHGRFSRDNWRYPAPWRNDYRYTGHTCTSTPVMIPINGTPEHRPWETTVHHDSPDTRAVDRPTLPDAQPRTLTAFTNDTPDTLPKTIHLMTARRVVVYETYPVSYTHLTLPTT